MKLLFARTAPPLVALILGLAIWHLLATAGGMPAYLLPTPVAVARAAREDGATLAAATWVTLQTSLTGFLLSGLFGVAIGVILARSRWLERGFYPYALVLQTVPIVAVAPLLVLWFGVGPRAVIASAVIVSVFPVIASTVTGIRAIDPNLRDLFRLYGASPLTVLWKLELPAATLSIATGLRIACGLAVIGAIVGEFVAGFAEGAQGLGILVLTSYRQLRTDLLFAAVFGSALLGLSMFVLVTGGAHLLLRRWNVAARD
jgi:NitT/TauT family transport system permease protein